MAGAPTRPAAAASDVAGGLAFARARCGAIPVVDDAFGCRPALAEPARRRRAGRDGTR